MGAGYDDAEADHMAPNDTEFGRLMGEVKGLRDLVEAKFSSLERRLDKQDDAIEKQRTATDAVERKISLTSGVLLALKAFATFLGVSSLAGLYSAARWLWHIAP